MLQQESLKVNNHYFYRFFMSVSEKVNVVSNVISNISNDPSERLGIAVCLAEIYKNELSKLLVRVESPAEKGENKDAGQPKEGTAT